MMTAALIEDQFNMRRDLLISGGRPEIDAGNRPVTRFLLLSRKPRVRPPYYHPQIGQIAIVCCGNKPPKSRVYICEIDYRVLLAVRIEFSFRFHEFRLEP